MEETIENEMDLEEPSMEFEIERPKKPKKVLTEKQKEQGRLNLAKGRAALAEKKRKEKEEQTKKADEMILKKAEKLKKQQVNKEKQLKTIIGDVDSDIDEIEERVVKKPKKKKIIYREESDSEEEVIIKKRKPKQEPVEPKETKQKEEFKPATFRINFC